MSISRRCDKAAVCDCGVRHNKISKNSQSDHYNTDGGKRRTKQSGKAKKAKKQKKEQRKLKEAMKRHMAEKEATYEEEETIYEEQEAIVEEQEATDEEREDYDNSNYGTPADRIFYPLKTPQLLRREYTEEEKFDLDDTPVRERTPDPYAQFRPILRHNDRLQDVSQRRKDSKTGDANYTIIASPSVGERKTFHGYRPKKIDYDKK